MTVREAPGGKQWIPNFIKPGDKRGLENTEEQAPTGWSGPDASVMQGLALKQPGAVRRAHGVKFQCAGCKAEGHDKSRDNACVFNDGRFSCAVGGAAHRAAIAQQLNIPQQPRVVAGEIRLQRAPRKLDSELEEIPPPSKNNIRDFDVLDLPAPNAENIA